MTQVCKIKDCQDEFVYVSLKRLQELESDAIAKQEGEEIVAELEAINSNLRKLLSECKEAMCNRFEYNQGYNTWLIEVFEPLLVRINAAIGDNEIQANPVADIKIQESEECLQ